MRDFTAALGIAGIAVVFAAIVFIEVRRWLRERQARKRRLNAIVAMARDLNGDAVMHKHGEKLWCINPTCGK